MVRGQSVGPVAVIRDGRLQELRRAARQRVLPAVIERLALATGAFQPFIPDMSGLSFKTIVFDLDDTIADTAPDLAIALNAIPHSRADR